MDLSPFPRCRTYLALVALILAVGVVCAGTLSNGFVWDDFDIIVDNRETHDIRNLGRVLLSPDLRAPYYRPLPRAMLVIEYALWGPTPWAFHLVSVLAHLAATGLLFFWARRLFRRDLPAFAVALLWGVHPVGAEAVGFVSVRTGTLAVLFGLASLLTLERAADHPDRRQAWASGLLFFLALASKEQALMLLPLAAWALRARRGGQAGAHRFGLLLPHVAALGAYGALRVIALGGLLGNAPRVVGRSVAMGPIAAALAVGRYVALAFWPAPLTVTHDLTQAARWPMLAGLATALACSAWAAKRRTPAATCGVLWFWLAVLPTLQVVAIPSAVFAERHAYVAYPGLALVVVDLLVAVRERWAVPAIGWVAVLALVVTAGALAVRTALRIPDWRDNRALFESALAVRPSALAHLNLGNLALAERDKTRAERHWRAAVEIDPFDADALNQLGVLAAQAQKFHEARDLFRRALDAFPEHPAARANLDRVEQRLRAAKDASGEAVE